jgi:hypothetical protein
MQILIEDSLIPKIIINCTEAGIKIQIKEKKVGQEVLKDILTKKILIEMLISFLISV